MAYLIKLSDIFLTDEIMGLNLDFTMSNVVTALSPPWGWDFAGDEVLPTIWYYNSLELRFENKAPHKLYLIEIGLNFHGHVSALTLENDEHGEELLIDHEGYTGDTKVSDLIQFLSEAGAAHGKKVKLEFSGSVEKTELRVGYGGLASATFTFDSDAFPLDIFQDLKPDDEEYPAREIALRDNPFKLEIYDPNWMKAFDEYADYKYIRIDQGVPDAPTGAATAKHLSAAEYLKLLEGSVWETSGA